MKKISKKNQKIINEINKHGYYVIKDFFNKKRLNYIKNSLLNILNYIYKDGETDLQKKYYTVKRLYPKPIRYQNCLFSSIFKKVGWKIGFVAAGIWFRKSYFYW